jgi:hypothetical protein
MNINERNTITNGKKKKKKKKLQGKCGESGNLFE